MYLKVVLRGVLFSTIQTRNVFYVSSNVAAELSTIRADMAAWMDDLLTPIMPFVTTGWASYEIDIYGWSASPPGWVYQTGTAFGASGTSSSDGLPSQVAAVVIAKTGIKKTFARKFIAGLTENTNIAGMVSSAAVSALLTFATTWIQGYEGTTVTYESGTWRKNNTFASFTEALVDTIFGTMRRRKLGVGI